jgi:hypothetical protein
MLPFQAGINAELGDWLLSPVRAAFVSFFVGAALLLVVAAALVFRPLPSSARVGHAPWWVWVGGALGASYVVGSIVSAPKLGAATLIALVVAAQASPRSSSTTSAGSERAEARERGTRRRHGARRRRVALVRFFSSPVRELAHNRCRRVAAPAVSSSSEGGGWLSPP